MNTQEILLILLFALSIFLIWRAKKQKPEKKKVIAKQTPSRRYSQASEENPDYIPPKGSRVAIIIQAEVFRTVADGKSTLKTLQESILWNHKDQIERKTRAQIPDILENLIPTKTPFMWRLDFQHHT